MSEWREDNLLEKLAHTSAKHADAGLCPEAEILCVSTEPEGTGPMVAKLTQHMESCPICSDLRHRLTLFEQPESLTVDSEAIEAERRLDSWMKGFLASQSLNPRTQPVESNAKVVTYPSAPRTRPFWKTRWALAAAAIVIITVGVVYIRRSIVALTPTTEVARATPDQAPPTPRPSDSQSLPETVPHHQDPRTVARQGPQTPKAPKPVSPAKTVTSSAPPPEMAVAPKPAPQTAAQTPPPTAPEAPTVAGNNTASTGSATVHAALPSARMAIPRQTSHAGEAKASNRTEVYAASAPPAPRPVTPRPIHVPAGTRIWISFQSTTTQSEGQFQFEGTLLLPVTASGALVLEKGIPVVGFGTTSGRQTSLTVTGFAFRGSRYKLRTASGANALQSAATGKVVQFQSGKVAEMWLDSDSTFEPVGDSGSPQK